MRWRKEAGWSGRREALSLLLAAAVLIVSFTAHAGEEAAAPHYDRATGEWVTDTPPVEAPPQYHPSLYRIEPAVASNPSLILMRPLPRGAFVLPEGDVVEEDSNPVRGPKEREPTCVPKPPLVFCEGELADIGTHPDDGLSAEERGREQELETQIQKALATPRE